MVWILICWSHDSCMLMIGEGSWRDRELGKLLVGENFPTIWYLMSKEELGKYFPSSRSFQLPFPTTCISVPASWACNLKSVTYSYLWLSWFKVYDSVPMSLQCYIEHMIRKMMTSEIFQESSTFMAKNGLLLYFNILIFLIFG